MSGCRRLKVEDLTRLCLVLGKSPEYFLQTDEVERAAEPRVGLTLRAKVAELPHEELSEAITAYLDYIETLPAPDAPLPDLSLMEPEAAARNVLERCGISGPPVRTSAIASSLAVPVVLWAFPDALSALVVGAGPDSFAIGVNRLHHRNRRRFSVAHELGHAVLRHKAGYYLEFSDPASFGEPPNYRYKDERAANIFAAALLMDSRWLSADFRAGERDVSELAYRYRVSEEAMSFRLLNLGLA